MNKELLHRDGTPMRKYSSPLINELNEETMSNKLDGLSELVTRIDAKILDINTKLDELIKALHAYDDDNIYSGYNEPNEVLLKAADLYNEAEANKRMDIIGQNGNEGSHYVTNEEADEDANNKIRVGKDRDNNNNTQGKRRGGKNKRKIDPIVKHEQFRQPHKN
jgi:hypothetical protein